jgi:hypothetical protein
LERDLQERDLQERDLKDDMFIFMPCTHVGGEKKNEKPGHPD